MNIVPTTAVAATYAAQTAIMADQGDGPLWEDEDCGHVECSGREECDGPEDAARLDLISHRCDVWCQLGLPLCPF